MIEPIRKQIDVACKPEQAFKILTENIAGWWPLGGHSVSAMNGTVAKSVVLESHVGGKLYEIGPDDETIPWGSVRIFEPGARIVLAWHIGKPETEATEVEFTFTSLPGGRTRVALEHRGWEASGEGAQDLRNGYNNGWVHVFEECYAGACAA